MTFSEKTSWDRFYLPEIHDLHPGINDRFERLLAALPAQAIDQLSLLLVPNWQGGMGSPPETDFWQKLSGMKGEKILHGWTHSLGPDLLNWLFYGHDNRSEFACLDKSAAFQRLQQAVSLYEKLLGRSPRWFCAPRWLQSCHTTEVLRSLGFLGCMHYDRLELFTGLNVPLQALCFDEGERRLRRTLGRLLRRRTIRALLDTGRPFRLSLHPADIDDPLGWQQLTSLIVRLTEENWQPLSLEEAVSLWQRHHLGHITKELSS